ncbi:MAG: cytochrome c, partial [Planctomycetaceae bacterium]|nr:cytochrome c [Planctomycetaceae bacterium]
EGFQLVQKYGCFGCHEMPGYDAGKAIGPDLRLEPQTAEELEAALAQPGSVPGTLRKVGPSLRHLAAKTSTAWVERWTQNPTGFRASTKMPRFFGLYSHLSEEEVKGMLGTAAAENKSGVEVHGTEKIEDAELAGIAHVLVQGSQDIDLLRPADDYEPSVERGKEFFSQKGCLACHQHGGVPGTTADFGPNISDIHLKVNRNADNPQFSDWLYSWIRDPERYHPRTRMPVLYLEPTTDGAGNTIDPAADITAWLLSQGEPGEYAPIQVDQAALDALIVTYLQKAGKSEAQAQKILADGKYDRVASDVVGDEAVLATDDGSAVTDAGEWNQRKLAYIGRKSLARYGCYACHDIPGYEAARPIGVALHDWGRKDTSKLGFEHIAHYLEHHGEPEGSEFASTVERVESAIKRRSAEGDGVSHFESPEDAEAEMTAAFFYKSLEHHGRPGFIWQKLRDPRSYDYHATETKGYVDRLRMPKFPFKNEAEIEAIATFILGMVAEPPSEEYLYNPPAAEKTRVEGEFLLAKFNCTGCHMVDLPEITYGVDPGQLDSVELAEDEHASVRNLLMKMRPPVKALTGESRKFMVYGEEEERPLMTFHGLQYSAPDKDFDEEDWEFGFDTWELLDVGTEDEPARVLPGTRILVPYSTIVDMKPGRGGQFAEWLVESLKESRYEGNPYLSWQSSPPPLIKEGHKVQTPWLYQFLLEPSQIRYTTVLRMPRFNMSTREAMVLANYFAAVDGVEFPYQEKGATDIDYLAAQDAHMKAMGLLQDSENYVDTSWKVLTEPSLCIKCHSVGGKRFQATNPEKDIQGPDLNVVQQRLRSDWVRLWLYKPTWVMPYTSMPVNFDKANPKFPTLFNGDADAQVAGARDALMNYGRLLEKHGPMQTAAAAAPAEAPEAEGAAPATEGTGDAASGAEE